MKWLIAAWLVLTVPLVHAVDCGPLVMLSKVTALQDSLTGALSALRQHQGVLMSEGSREARESEFQKIFNEIDRLNLSMSGGEQIEIRLDAISILVSIRDFMVDKQDKLIVEQYISLYGLNVKNTAEIVFRSISKTLTQVSRPGVAIDVSKLRDAIGTVVGEFERCEAPKPLSRRPATRQK